MVLMGNLSCRETQSPHASPKLRMRVGPSKATSLEWRSQLVSASETTVRSGFKVNVEKKDENSLQAWMGWISD